LAASAFRLVFQWLYHRWGYRNPQDVVPALRERLARGERCLILGVQAGDHNAGAALVEVSAKDGVRLLHSNEEERYSAIKHASCYPSGSVKALQPSIAGALEAKTIGAATDVVACCSWNHCELFATMVSDWAAHAPCSSLSEFYSLGFDWESFKALPARLEKDLSIRPNVHYIRHHDTHAWFPYAVSPFYKKPNVMVLVMDGNGDVSSTTLYVSDESGVLHYLEDNGSFLDSLGELHGLIASTQGGWTPLSAGGRYMGAAAWGNLDRFTNPYYSCLREVVVFAPQGRVLVNREYVNRLEHSYRPFLEEVLGEAIPADNFWNPDRILSVDDVQISEFTRQRCDKAAATQLVFEDAVAHVLRYFIEKTGSNHLVWSGGCALNCRASLILLEHFNKEFYQRLDHGTGREERTLHMWVPPVPNDAGGPVGAAFALAFQAWPPAQVAGSGSDVAPTVPGMPPAWPLPHAFLCGQGSTLAEVDQALAECSDVKSIRLDLGEDELADFMAYVVSNDGVMGIFQRSAEMGPRALGHRTILANPINPQTLEVLNSRVKLREKVRPLAPMVTQEAAYAMWHLEPGASDSSYDAYRYMVLCARAKPIAWEKVPAIVHVDGTSRIQLVRESDGLVHKYLKRMGVRCGVEVSVNTSLNVGSPIVQTVKQAIGALLKSAGMHAILVVADCGTPVLVYGAADDGKLKDGGRQLLQWLDEWRGLSRK